MDLAIQYARHAVAIEGHPFPWTTLASLLSRKIESLSAGVDVLYNEICDLLNKVIKHEKSSRSWRPTPHPYTILFGATNIFISKGGKLSPKIKGWILEQVEFSSKNFSRDRVLNASGGKIIASLKSV